MAQQGVVNTDRLNLRPSPSTELPPLGLLLAGEVVTVLGQTATGWFHVETHFGPGFVHGDFLTVQAPAPEEPSDGPDEPDAPGEPDEPVVPELPDIVEPGRAIITGCPEIYIVKAGDNWPSIAAELGVPASQLALASGLSTNIALNVNQLLRVPPREAPVGGPVLRNPLAGASAITSSSSNGHHTPYGGTHSADLDVTDRDTRGAEVRFNVELQGVDLRGQVTRVSPACASGKLEDGGHRVDIELERRPIGGAEWTAVARLTFAHLDPVDVALGATVIPGEVIGRLGPPPGEFNTQASIGHAHPEGDPRRGEYHSSCAIHSHLHLEVTNGASIASFTDDLSTVPLATFPA